MHIHILSVVWRKNDGKGPPVAISATRRSFGGALFSRNMLTAHNQSPWPHFPRLDVEQVRTTLVANCRPGRDGRAISVALSFHTQREVIFNEYI